MVKLQPSLVYVLEVNPASPAWESGRIGVGDIIRSKRVLAGVRTAQKMPVCVWGGWGWGCDKT